MHRTIINQYLLENIFENLIFIDFLYNIELEKH